MDWALAQQKATGQWSTPVSLFLPPRVHSRCSSVREDSLLPPSERCPSSRLAAQLSSVICRRSSEKANQAIVVSVTFSPPLPYLTASIFPSVPFHGPVLLLSPESLAFPPHTICVAVLERRYIFRILLLSRSKKSFGRIDHSALFGVEVCCMASRESGSSNKLRSYCGGTRRNLMGPVRLIALTLEFAERLWSALSSACPSTRLVSAGMHACRRAE